LSLSWSFMKIVSNFFRTPINVHMLTFSHEA
jgi:hypothetical protein